MQKLIDITNMRFGRLLVLEHEGMKNRSSLWRCICDCGAVKSFQSANLRSGRSRSCGCYQREVRKRMSYRHGHATKEHGKTDEYLSWLGMFDRCRRESHRAYKNYGARGITVCERWTSFSAFLADMGPCPKGHSIERIDPNGNYEPRNCRWATFSDQCNNKRSTVWVVDTDGERLSLARLARKHKIPYLKLYNAMRTRKLSAAEAIAGAKSRLARKRKR